jgi:hydroxymethylglutaryl-CoA lyase
MAKELYDAGCYEISLGDTIGIGTAGSMSTLLEHVLKVVPVEAVAVHCHDTYGQALANILKALEVTIAIANKAVLLTPL